MSGSYPVVLKRDMVDLAAVLVFPLIDSIRLPLSHAPSTTELDAPRLCENV